MSSRLCAHVLHMVRNRSRLTTYEDIADATGITVPWLKRFGRGANVNPTVDEIELLYSYFTQEELELKE